jgi:hypothetical protein
LTKNPRLLDQFVMEFYVSSKCLGFHNSGSSVLWKKTTQTSGGTLWGIDPIRAAFRDVSFWGQETGAGFSGIRRRDTAGSGQNNQRRIRRSTPHCQIC